LDAGRCDEAKEAAGLLVGLADKLQPESEADPGTRITREEVDAVLYRYYQACGDPQDAKDMYNGDNGRMLEADARCMATSGAADMEGYLARSKGEHGRKFVTPALVTALLAAGKPDQALAVAVKYSVDSNLPVALIQIGAYLARTGTPTSSEAEALLRGLAAP
jgi:hypothetical protein